jgi:hypothetical protein
MEPGHVAVAPVLGGRGPGSGYLAWRFFFPERPLGDHDLSAPAEPTAGPRISLVRRVEPADCVAVLLCATAFTGWSIAAGGRLNAGGLALAILLPWALLAVGRVVLRVTDAGGDIGRRFPVALLVGAAVFALVLMVTRLLLPVDIRVAAALLWLGAVIASLRARPAAAAQRPGRWYEVFVVALALVAATLWARDMLRPVVERGDTLVFRTWLDYFIHANLAAMFSSDGSVIGLGNFQASGRPIIVYHYASYVYPALVSAASEASAYRALTGFWTPFGIFLTALAAYSLADDWWGRGAGTCALAGVVLLPDASSYGARAAFYSYHWLLQAGAPAALYGIAVSAVALLLVAHGARRAERRTLLAGLALGTSVFFFKAQLLVALLPLLCGWAIAFDRKSPPVRRLVRFGALVVAGVLVVAAVNRFHLGPPIRTDGTGAMGYLQYVGGDLPESAFKALYGRWTSAAPTPKGLTGLAMLTAIATFGLLPVLGIGLAIYALGAKRLQAVDALPALAIAIYLGMVMGLAATTSHELQHRPFVWAYFLVAAWTSGKLYSLARADVTWLRRADPWVPALVAMALLVVPAKLGRGVNVCPLPWAVHHCPVPVAKGLVECAEFLRTHSPKRDVVQDSAADEDLIVGGLGERRSYFCRPTLISVNPDHPAGAKILKRRGPFERLKAAASADELARVATAIGVQWYVLHPGDHVGWPREVLANPAFTSEGYAVYRLGQQPPGPPAALARRPVGRRG